MSKIFKYPKTVAIFLTSTSLTIGLLLLALTNMGISPWIYIPMLCWLCTLGLPTTLAVLFNSSIWGRVFKLGTLLLKNSIKI